MINDIPKRDRHVHVQRTYYGQELNPGGLPHANVLGNYTYRTSVYIL